MVDVLGVGGLIDEFTGEPAVLRWLSVRFDMWVQVCLVRDVSRIVEPVSGVLGPAAALVRTEGHGVMVTARFGDDRPPNPVATAMLAAVGVDQPVNGAAAWLGVPDPGTGLHADLQRVLELRALAAHCRSG